MTAVLVTGASSGIGKAVCELLAHKGAKVYATARRLDRLEELAKDYPTIIPIAADVSDEQDVDNLVNSVGGIDAIVHAAGGARGRSPILESDSGHWSWMWRTNVLGSMYVLRALVPRMVARGAGTIVVVTSVAAFECLEGSSGYSATKHAQSAIVRTLRDELLGTGIHVTEVAPGLVKTEFFKERFSTDPKQAEKMFAGIDPLQAKDVAEVIGFVLSQPPHVNIDRIVLRPTAQGSHGRIVRD